MTITDCYIILCNRLTQQVNFSVKDGLPEDECKAVLHRSGGSTEMITVEEEKAEPSYR